MGEMVTTKYAVRVMGRWVRRADALLQEGAVANAGRAVHDQQRRAARQAAELAAVQLHAPGLAPLAG